MKSSSVRLSRWQVLVLVAPPAAIIGFILVAAGWQIQRWGLSWIWAFVVLILLWLRWFLVRWTRPPGSIPEQSDISLAHPVLESQSEINVTVLPEIERQLQTILVASREDAPAWQDWPLFWQRCQEVVTVVAQAYYPKEKYPLLTIYLPDAYGLVRGTVDEMDRWLETLSPTLNQISLAQVYQSYEVYQSLEPRLKKLWRLWNWSQWLLNPPVAIARYLSQEGNEAATQQLVLNLQQQAREATLKTLCRQAIALYSPDTQAALPDRFTAPSSASPVKAKTTTLKALLTQVEPPEQVASRPVKILLVGRTGAGKSSLINALFQQRLAQTDVLPSTTDIAEFQWQTAAGEQLILWDSPGYEQTDRPDLRQQVLDYSQQADILLLLTPALDPALQMDQAFLQDWQQQSFTCPLIIAVTQADRLRPFREWSPPYDWLTGNRPKEVSIREAVQYRAEQLNQYTQQVFPLVSGDASVNRVHWGLTPLSVALVETIAPAQQQRLARFLESVGARAVAAAQIIDRYALQMTTTQGITALLKSPVLQFLSQISTGSPTLAYILAEKIPVEELPLVLGKLQLAYELYTLLVIKTESPEPERNTKEAQSFELLNLWPLLIDNPVAPDRNAWSLGHALLEYWTQNLSLEALKQRFRYYCEHS